MTQQQMTILKRIQPLLWVGGLLLLLVALVQTGLLGYLLAPIDLAVRGTGWIVSSMESAGLSPWVTLGLLCVAVGVALAATVGPKR